MRAACDWLCLYVCLCLWLRWQLRFLTVPLASCHTTAVASPYAPVPVAAAPTRTVVYTQPAGAYAQTPPVAPVAAPVYSAPPPSSAYPAAAYTAAQAAPAYAPPAGAYQTAPQYAQPQYAQPAAAPPAGYYGAPTSAPMVNNKPVYGAPGAPTNAYATPAGAPSNAYGGARPAYSAPGYGAATAPAYAPATAPPTYTAAAPTYAGAPQAAPGEWGCLCSSCAPASVSRCMTHARGRRHTHTRQHTQ